MDGVQLISENRKARHDYHIDETMEVGIVLQGTEVKSVRGRRVNIKDSYAMVINGEVFLHNMHISPYEQANRFNHEPLRIRKLLLNKSEIRRLIGLTREKGLTLVPLKVYMNKGRVKLELGVARGKKQYDKRQDLMAKDARREIERAFRDKQRS